MNIAFYSPIKPPDHPVPSGDRTMANHLIAALRLAGHRVALASRLRSYSSVPDHAEIEALAAIETQNLLSGWSSDNAADKPDVWFTYHPYYKAPDLIGPAVCAALNIPYMTAEASYSSRRQSDEWQASQTHVIEAVRQAQVNFCMTSIDREGLNQIVAHERLCDLPAFIDTAPYQTTATQGRSGPSCRLITVAMMRRGVKFDSYELLAAALRELGHKEWSIAIIGDGSARDDVAGLFDGIDADRIDWLGELSGDEVRKQLGQSDIFVWPGFGEAYGLAYLEAQACGLPVIAHDTHGVPSVVRNGITGLLTPPGDAIALAEAIDRLATDDELRARMSLAAHRFVHQERNLAVASIILNQALVRATTPASSTTVAS